MSLVVALSLTAAADAGPKVRASPVAPEARPVQPPVAVGTKHIPLSIVDNWSGAQAALAAGYNDTDPVTRFSCQNNNGCTVISSSHAQYLTTVDGSNWAICTYIDGALMNHSCYFQGPIDISDQFVSGSDRENLQVAKGAHTIHTQIYVANAGTLGSYQYDYEVTSP
jgi:hypothetical protein